MSTDPAGKAKNAEMLTLTADIVSAHLANNSVATSDVPALIQAVHSALASLGKPAIEEQPKAEPAVPIRTSVKPDYIVCLEDGARLKMLKRYLRSHFDMSPDDYRSKWGLPRDYPMVAPSYATTRQELAKKIGLGRKKVVEVAAAKGTNDDPIADATPAAITAAKPVRKRKAKTDEAEA